MLKRKTTLLTFLIILVILAGLFIYASAANGPQSESPVATAIFVPAIIPVDNFGYIMYGPSGGTVLLIDSISDNEYAELMTKLYPDGVVDDMGIDIPGANNVEEFEPPLLPNIQRPTTGRQND